MALARQHALDRAQQATADASVMCESFIREVAQARVSEVINDEAVKHRCAQMRVQVESLRSLVYGAAQSGDAPSRTVLQHSRRGVRLCARTRSSRCP